MTDAENVPKDLPTDIWLTACDVAHDVFDANCELMEQGRSAANPALMIANAILAERERCAKVAEAHDLDPEYADAIAAAIRS